MTQQKAIRSIICSWKFQEDRPDLPFLFGLGYSMEHPNLLEAIDFCRSIGSATGEFLQFDGMKFCSRADLKNHGI